MRRATVLLAALALLLVTAAPASANNDPHRSFLPAAPFDLPGGTGGICAFPVHVAFPDNNEYGTTSTLPDGSTLLKVTGTSFMSATNLNTGKMLIANTSSEGTYTYLTDGVTVIGNFHGPSWLEAPNQTAFGFPSNFVVVAGSVLLTLNSTTGEYISLSGHQHVLIDVCAALS
jgi:hypothetical protein